MSESAISILPEPADWLPLALPGSRNVEFKVYKADEARNTVVLKARFGKDGRMPRHSHHCYAIVYTISGQWEYDEGGFGPGAVAYEEIGNDHVPSSEDGTEMFITFISPNGQFLDNDMPDGSALHIGMRFFKAVEGLSLAGFAALDVASLLDPLPAKRPGGEING